LANGQSVKASVIDFHVFRESIIFNSEITIDNALTDIEEDIFRNLSDELISGSE
jgi:hypothetical protein